MAGNNKTDRVFSSYVSGFEGEVVTIEISLTPGLPSFDIIGKCDSAIKESKTRILTAIKNSGYKIPKGHITVSISPAFLSKTGTGFDLPIAIGILRVSNQIPSYGSAVYACGELSLNGEVHTTPGSMIRLTSIKNSQYDAVLVSSEDRDCSACSHVPCSFVGTLKEVCDMFRTQSFNKQLPKLPVNDEKNQEYIDFSVLKGQEKASRTVLLAAAGWHNTLLIGSSGSGKTTAAEIVRGLLPDLSTNELSETFSLINALGFAENISSDLYKRPFRSVTPSINASALIGSASGLKPGEICLANRGVLFVDELCEFTSKMIDHLRIPMESRVVSLKNGRKSISFPSDFLFVGASNPCRCGMYFENPNKCTCSKAIRNGYLNKLSGPFIDRIDLCTELYSVNANALKESVKNSDKRKSIELRKMVSACWEIQHERYKYTDNPLALNGSFDSDNLSDVLRADKSVIEIAAEAASVGGYSVRSFKRLLKVGRTIADLDERKDLSRNDITEAMSYRFRRIV